MVPTPYTGRQKGNDLCQTAMMHESSLASDQDDTQLQDRDCNTHDDSIDPTPRSCLSASSSIDTDSSRRSKSVYFRHRVSYKMIESTSSEKSANARAGIGLGEMGSDGLLLRIGEQEINNILGQPQLRSPYWRIDKAYR
mmetsp:Transcript_56567/g.89840  ORF Transcript_56567/g.89840 Transcript_56567/m.89840 type:complete len:139 (-) Transcript_56567:72-488(-)